MVVEVSPFMLTVELTMWMQLMMRGNMLTPYNVLGRLPTGAYGAVPEKQVENLVADLLDSLERPTVKR